MKFQASALSIFLLVSASVSSSFAFNSSLQQRQQQQQWSRKVQSSSFTNSNGFDPSRSYGRQASSTLQQLTPQDLTDYMAKANEAKVQAMKQIEDKKNAEIKALKEEVEELKKKADNVAITHAATTPPPPPPANLDVDSMTKEELISRLVTYQQFISKYIVQAQEQKMQAVAAAEAKVKAKYAEKIKLLTGSAPTPAPPAVPAADAAATTTLYKGRSENVAAAAKAGKSRWGDMETAKAAAVASGGTTATTPVNGVAVLASIDSTPPVVAAGGDNLFNQRNQMVAAAGAAGKSRWGDAEVKKATEEAAKAASLPSSSTSVSVTPASSQPTIDVTPEIEAADHGLRNDGGVGGPSLAERVNLGLQIVEASSSATTGATQPPTIETTTTTTAPPIKVTAEIEAADHGLRNDGGVGGPSLAERVNLGLAIVEGGTDTVSSSAMVTDTDSSKESLYSIRNARVAAAAAAGRSRWGEPENQKIQTLVSSATLPPSAPAPAAAAVAPASVTTTTRKRVNIAFGVDPNLP